MAKLKIQIPEDYQPGFAKLFRLEDDDIARLLHVLNEAPLRVSRDSLSDDLAPRLDFLSESEARSVLTSILSLYDLRTQLEESADDVVTALLEASDRSKAEELSLNDEEKKRASLILASLLKIDNLECRSKILDLGTANRDTFLNARVITDIRPVYAGSVEAPPSAALLVHFLRIRYMCAAGPRELYVAVDGSDIDDLIEVLERARKKAKSLEQVLNAASIPYVGGE